MEINTLLNFIHIAEKLKCNTRHSYTSTNRHESVAEHSWRLSLMAYLVKDEFPGADINKVILMCLFHDIGEAITKDIPAFEKTEKDEKTESSIVDSLINKLPQPYKTELKNLFLEMNEQLTAEAKLYKALDKLEALIQHNEADISTWLPLERELQLTYGTEECDFSSYTKELRKTAKIESEQKIKKASS